MSKRAKPEGGSSSSATAGSSGSRVLELKLHELQAYVDDSLRRREGAQRSTRAYSDALLNVEIKLLRQREVELLQRVADLERSHNTNALTEQVRRLQNELDETRAQVGDKATQMRLQQLELKDAMIHSLVQSLGQAKRETLEAAKQNEALQAEVLLCKRQQGQGHVAAMEVSKTEGDDDFDRFIEEAAQKG